MSIFGGSRGKGSNPFGVPSAGGSGMGGAGRGALGGGFTIGGTPARAPSAAGSRAGAGTGSATSVKTISEADFQTEVLRSEIPVLLQFTADWCQPCKAIAPEVESFAGEMAGKVKVLRVDVDRSPVLKQQFRIQSVPTFMLIAQGRLADAVAGALNRKQLRELVEPFLPRAEGALKAEELAELLKAGAVVPIDTREKAAYDRAHLPGAKHMALEEIEGRLAELHMFAGQPVLYCRSGDKTKELATTLAERGLPVAFLEGGLLGWESSGLPVERP